MLDNVRVEDVVGLTIRINYQLQVVLFLKCVSGQFCSFQQFVTYLQHPLEIIVLTLNNSSARLVLRGWKQSLQSCPSRERDSHQ